jgi:phosphomannomutase
LRIAGGEADFAIIRRRLLATFPAADISEFDGVRVDTGRAWLLVRTSVSENKLSFRFEGETKDELASLMDRVMNLLPEYAPLLLDRITQWRVWAA